MTTDLVQLQQDVITAAGLMSVIPDEDKIARAIQVYGDWFKNSAIEFKTTSKDTPELAFRYVNLTEPIGAPYQTALDHDLYTSDGREAEALYHDVMDTVPLVGHGVDFGADFGLEKIWPFTSYFEPLTTMQALPNFPSSLDEHAELLRAYGFDGVTIMAIDLRNNTTNLYFYRPQSLLSTQTFRRFLDELGLVSDVDEAIISRVERAPVFNMTFRWGSPAIDRVCYYYPIGSIYDEPPMVGSTKQMDTFLYDSPMATPQRGFIMGDTYTPQGYYFKPSCDYNGGMLPMLQYSMSVLKVRPTP